MLKAVMQGVSTPSIADRMLEVGRPTSGFDYLRLSLSISVLIWHSMLVTKGLDWASGAMLTFSGVSVRLILPMFFALSGFLVAGSLERNPSISVFVTFRALRIIPALAVETALSAILIGALATTLSLPEYFIHPAFYAYFLNIIGWIHYNLPGVFAGMPDDTVNRSLWTIPTELECYLFLVLLATLGVFRSRLRLTFVVILIYAAYVLFRIIRDGSTPGFQPYGGTVLSRLLIFYFMGGVLFYRLRHRIPFNIQLFIPCGIISIISLALEDAVWLSIPALVYATVFLGLKDPQRVKILFRGDYSYGVYLYAYPIQQTYIWLLPNQAWYINVALSLPTTMLFAVFSWHLVEKPALKLKERFSRKLTSSGSFATAARVS